MPLSGADQSNFDVVFVESRADSPGDGARGVVGMEGRYTLEGWRDAQDNLRQFPCRVVRMTPNAIELGAPVTGAVGDWVVVHFDTFGRFEGPVVRIAERTLVMRPVATADERHKVAEKIAWI